MNLRSPGGSTAPLQRSSTEASGSQISLPPTCSILLRESSHGDLGGCDCGGLQGQAGQRVDDHVGGHGGVSRGRELAAGVGDEAGVNAQGLGEEPALLEEGGVDLEERSEHVLHMNQRTDSRDGLKKRLQSPSENSIKEQFHSSTETKHNYCLMVIAKSAQQWQKKSSPSDRSCAAVNDKGSKHTYANFQSRQKSFWEE